MEAQDLDPTQYVAALLHKYALLLHVTTGTIDADATNEEIVTNVAKEQAKYEKVYPLPSSPADSSFIE